MDIVRIRMRQVPVVGYPEQPITQLLATLRCPHCHRTAEHELTSGYEIWRWGLDEAIEEQATKLLVREELETRSYVTTTRVFYCGNCGVGSIVTERDVKLFVGELRTALGHLPEGFGTPFALIETAKFMVRHLKDPDVHHFHHDGRGGRYDEFLLYYCPCETCDQSRLSDYKRIELAPKHFDLDYFRSLMPEPELVTS